MRKSAVATLLIAVVAGVASLLAAPRAPRLADRSTVDADLAASVRAAVDGPEGLRGMAVALVENGRVRVAGLGDRGDGAPVEPGTPFEIGSVTKGLTGLLLAQLVADGTVRPDDTLRAALPDVDGAVGDVTLAELASHRAGLPRLPITSVGHGLSLYWANLRAADPYAGQDLRWLVRAAGGERPGDKRGEVDYSNFGVALLGQALATRAGTSYPELLARTVLRPLGMTRTGFSLDGAAPPVGAASGGTVGGRAAAPWTGSGWAPAGVAAWSTAEDLGKLVAALLAGAAPGADATAARYTEDERTRIGYGWFTTRHGDREIVWHNGGTGGFRSYVGFDRAAGRGVVLLGNTTRDVGPIGLRLLGVPSDAAGDSDGGVVGWIGVALALAFTFQGGLNLFSTARRGPDRLRLAAAALWAPVSLLLAYQLGNWMLVPGWAWSVGAGLTAAGLAIGVRRWRELPLISGVPTWRRWTGTTFSALFAGVATLAALG